MAIPAAPQELGGSKILFSVDDNSGTTRANLLRGYRHTTINGDDVAALGTYDVSGGIENGGVTLGVTTATQINTSSVPGQWAIVKARSTNAGTIYVGKSDVTADTNATTGGYPLDAGEAVGVPCSNLNQVYIRGGIGDGAAWIASID